MAIPLRLCWGQLDSVWMNWLLKSQLYPEMPVKTCSLCTAPCSHSPSWSFFLQLHTQKALTPCAHKLGEGGDSQVSALALPWSVSRRPGTCTGQLALNYLLWLFNAAERESAPHLLRIQEYPAKSLAARKYWLTGGRLLQSWNSSSANILPQFPRSSQGYGCPSW